MRATHRCTKWTCSSDWIIAVCVWFVPLVWCKCYTFRLISCIQEEKEGDGGSYEPPTSSIISERGPQTPSMFPPPSPYSSTEHSLELAAPTVLHPEPLEMGLPREEQAWVCFRYTYICMYVVYWIWMYSNYCCMYSNCISVWNSFLWFTGYCTYMYCSANV